MWIRATLFCIQTATTQVASGQGQSTSQSGPGDHVCEVCRRTLPSRNKLFQHIKETGHAALRHVEEGQHQSGAGSATKRTKKKRPK